MTEHMAAMRLTLDVAFEDCEEVMTTAEIAEVGKRLLNEMVDTALNRGMLTDDSPVTIETWSQTVTHVMPEVAAGELSPRLALQNCLALAARYRKEAWARDIIRFCGEAGVKPTALRAVGANGQNAV